MSQLNIKFKQEGTITKITLSGVIDEDANFSPFDLSGNTNIELDLEMVESINSCGIREWVKWMKTAGTIPLSFYNCHKIIIEQINMIQGFLPNHAKVMSFYVLYYSAETDEEKEVLLTFETHYNDKDIISTPRVVDDQQNPMEMDVVPDKYFKFLKRISKSMDSKP